MTTDFLSTRLATELRRLGATSWCANLSTNGSIASCADFFDPNRTATASHATAGNFDFGDAAALGLHGVAGSTIRATEANRRFIASSGYPELSTSFAYTVMFPLIANLNLTTPSSRTPETGANATGRFLHRFGGDADTYLGVAVGKSTLRDSIGMGNTLNWHVASPRCVMHYGDNTSDVPSVLVDGVGHVLTFQYDGALAFGYCDHRAGDQGVAWNLDLTAEHYLFYNQINSSTAMYGIDLMHPIVFPSFLTDAQRNTAVSTILATLGAERSSAASAAGGSMDTLNGTVAAVPMRDSNALQLTLDGLSGQIGSHLVGMRCAVTDGDARHNGVIRSVDDGHGTKTGTVRLHRKIAPDPNDPLPAVGDAVTIQVSANVEGHDQTDPVTTVS